LHIAELDWPFQTALDKNNLWVKMSDCIPWDELAVTMPCPKQRRALELIQQIQV